MKRKVSFLILFVLVLPLFALLGCDEVPTYNVNVYTSDGVYGTVSGDGTYASGSTVTLTATPKGNGTFVSWIYQNSTELKTDGTYTVSTSNETSKSTLSFKISESTKGSYTAVFDEKGKTEGNKMFYIKLDSYRLTTLDPSTNNGTTESDDLLSAMTNANLTFYHGKTSNDLVEVAKYEEIDLLNNYINQTSDISQVLNLSTYSSQHVYVRFSGEIGGKSILKDFHSNITYKTSSQESQNSAYSYKVNYSTNGTYQLIFKFLTTPNDETSAYYFVVNYKNLSTPNSLTA